MSNNRTTKHQYKSHKLYRWIALFAKLISLPLFQFAFSKLTFIMFGKQTLGGFLATTLSLVIYYGIIFILNRRYNFQNNKNLGSSIAVYSVIVILLLGIESVSHTPFQNYLYSLTNLGYKDYISISTVNNSFVYALIGISLSLIFSFITGVVIFFFFKYFLTKDKE